MQKTISGTWGAGAIGFTDLAAAESPKSILDVGSGTGTLAFLLAERHPDADLTGIDFSQPYVDFAAARAPDPRIRFEQGDATAMRFPDQEFDNALSLLVLNFIPDAQ